MLIRDNGDVELVGVKDGVVKIRLKGACEQCTVSQMTLKTIIELQFKNTIPGVVSVELA